MNRKERLEMAIDKGYKCNPKTGDIFGPHGKKISNGGKSKYTRFAITIDKSSYRILAHQFVWYYVNGEIAEFIDHINRDKKDNKISNLRSVTPQQNQFNLPAKGYSWDKVNKKYVSCIKVNTNTIFLGRFDNKDEAIKAYLDAKKIYHII